MMNKLKINLIGMSFAVVIILAPIAVYGFECVLDGTGTCPVDKPTCVYSMSSDTNAHVGNCDAYSWKMCCDGLTSATIRTLDVDCSANEQGILSLYDVNGSHAEKYDPDAGVYSNHVCIDPVDNNISCEYKIGSCDTGSACLGSLFSETNSHMAQCSDASYNIKICCGVSIPEGRCHDHNVEGWAWSSNIGWISFSCEDRFEVGGEEEENVDYGVDINTETQEFSGYAWSSNVGWISFNQTDLTGCDDGNCIAELVNGEVFGWAKVLSSGEFIKLRGFTDETVPQEFGVSLSGDEFRSWAYGDQTTGWISFNCADRDVCGTGEGQSNYKVTTSFSPPHDKPSGLTIKWDDCYSKQESIPTFSWEYNGTGDSDGYEIWIDNDLGFTDCSDTDHNCIQVKVEGMPSTDYKHNEIVYNNDGDSGWTDELHIFEWAKTPYYWKVKTKDTQGWSGWSDIETFNTHIHAYPWVDFSYSPISPIVNNQIQFCSKDEGDCSELLEGDLSEVFGGAIIDSYLWDFFGGETTGWEFRDETITNASVNPVGFYTIPGESYSAKLTITDDTLPDDFGPFSCSKTYFLDIDLPLPIWKEIMPF